MQLTVSGKSANKARKKHEISGKTFPNSLNVWYRRILIISPVFRDFFPIFPPTVGLYLHGEFAFDSRVIEL